MKQALLLLTVIVSLMQLGIVCQAEECNAYTTAWSLVYEENPKTAFNEAFHKKVDYILRELEQISPYLTAKCQREVWKPRCIRLGKVILKIKEAYKEKFLNGKVVDGIVNIGDQKIDALFKKYQVSALEKSEYVDDLFYLIFFEQFNPDLVSDDLQAIEAVKWASPDHVGRIGGLDTVVRLAGKEEKGIPTIYVISIGWGDCMAGCIYNNYNYFEITYRQEWDQEEEDYTRSIPVAKFLNWGGDELENRGEYFNPNAK